MGSHPGPLTTGRTTPPRLTPGSLPRWFVGNGDSGRPGSPTFMHSTVFSSASQGHPREDGLLSSLHAFAY